MYGTAHANTGLIGRACVREVLLPEAFPPGPPEPTRSNGIKIHAWAGALGGYAQSRAQSAPKVPAGPRCW